MKSTPPQATASSGTFQPNTSTADESETAYNPGWIVEKYGDEYSREFGLPRAGMTDASLLAFVSKKPGHRSDPPAKLQGSIIPHEGHAAVSKEGKKQITVSTETPGYDHLTLQMRCWAWDDELDPQVQDEEFSDIPRPSLDVHGLENGILAWIIWVEDERYYQFRIRGD